MGHQNDIELIDFDFFSSLYITDIGERDLRFYQVDNIVVETGEVVLNQLGGYDYTFEEAENNYSISFGVILSQPGSYSPSSFTNDFEQSGYRHPAMFTCKDNLRMNVFIDRINRYSTRENFEDYNDWNRVETANFIQTFEGYVSNAKYTFKVVE